MSILAAIQSQFFKIDAAPSRPAMPVLAKKSAHKTPSPLTLSKAKTGSIVEVVRFCDCCEESRRMNELGLYPGAQVEVLAAGTWGRPVMLRIGSGKIAVCSKLAKQIFIQPPGLLQAS